MYGHCYGCKICNGRACGRTIPGPGAKGVGDVAIRNYDMWKQVRLNLNVVYEAGPVSTEVNIFGKDMAAPIFAGPVGAVQLHYGDKFTEFEYNDLLIKSCIEAGIIGFTGDGTDEQVLRAAAGSIAAAGGQGIPTIKPWHLGTVGAKMALVKGAGAFAVAMDVDAAGLPFLKGKNPPAGPKSQEELIEIAEMAGRPFIVKGIMTPKAAIKAVKAGAAAIVVSNHGGRVLDQCPSTAEVLLEIAEAIKGSPCLVFVDGGIRDGVDIFKAIAMGADGVLMARPFVNAIYQQGYEGVLSLVRRLKSELEDTMLMCGAKTIAEINKDMVRIPKLWQHYDAEGN